MSDTPCLGGIAYAFAEAARSVAELGAAGLLASDAAVLEGFGFGHAHVAVAESPYQLALAAARRLLEDRRIAPESVDLLLYGGTPGPLAQQPADAPWDGGLLQTTARFKYPAARLQYELGLERATVLGLDQLACVTLFGAVRVARALCLAEGLERVLCVASEFFPAAAGREAIFNCTSDAAVALLVERSGARNRIAGAAQVTKGYYWDCDALRDEIVASYFPTAVHVVERALASAGWRPDDVDWVIPHNVSRTSWEILMGLLGLPRARLWAGNIARRGHALAGDNFINLCDALTGGDVRPGEKLLLFAYGYGAHWTALAVEA
jgi:3-oxoacyl-[acyl-carrier-protein] synthase-3